MTETIGERLKKLREKKGWSLKIAGARLGVSRQCVNYWENNVHQPTAICLIALADEYDSTIDYIVRGVEPGGEKKKD